MRVSSERLLIGTVLTLSLVTLGLQAFALRPRMWPAGPGMALSGDMTFARWAAPSSIAVIRPPDVRGAVAGTPVTTVRVVPNGPADRAGIRDGDRGALITLNQLAYRHPPGLKFESLQYPLDGPPRSPGS